MKTPWIPLWAGLLLPLLAQGAERGTVFVETPLRAGPSPTAEALGTLPADTAVSIEASKGLWLRVVPTAGGQGSGWVRRFDVRTAAAAKRDSGGGGLGALGSILSGGGQRDQVTPTIGIRGLDAADLEGARPDPRAVAALDAYRASPGEAERMARAAGLSSREVPYPEGGSGSRPPTRDAGGDDRWLRRPCSKSA